VIVAIAESFFSGLIVCCDEVYPRLLTVRLGRPLPSLSTIGSNRLALNSLLVASSPLWSPPLDAASEMALAQDDDSNEHLSAWAERD
jgi:hypothetical protein